MGPLHISSPWSVLLPPWWWMMAWHSGAWCTGGYTLWIVGRAKFWNIVIFSHIFVSWGSTKRKSVVTSPIVQSWAPGTHLNIMLFCPVIGCLGCSALWLVQMVQQEIFPGAQLCTMGDVTTLFLFDEPQLTIIWLNITMFQNFAQPNQHCIMDWLLHSHGSISENLISNLGI